MANKCKYYKRQELVSYDGGKTWSPTGVYFKGSLIEASSSDCPIIDTKFSATYSDGRTYSAECTSQDEALTTATTRPSGYEYSAMTEAIIGDCVTSIGGSAFANCSSLTSVTIPDSVTSIGNGAFRNCYSLTSITILDSVTSIGSNAFQSCSGLTAITCNAITPPTLGSGVFSFTNNCPIYVPCQSLEAYKTAWSAYASRIQCVEPPTPTGLKFFATYNDGRTYSAECDGETGLITTTTKPSGYYFTGMTSAEIGNCVTILGLGVFSSCYSLTAITIPNGVTSIGETAFAECWSLTNVNIPSGVTYIGAWTFGNCRSLQSVTIPSGVTIIHEGVLEGCSSLTSITIPSGVTRIEDDAFSGCSSLTAITIPSGVTSIGSQAFSGCSSLTSITCNAITPPALGSQVFNNTNKCPIYVPCESVDAYKSSWSGYASRIQCVEPVFDGKFKATYSDGQTYSAECDSSTELTSATTRPSGYQYSAMTEAIIGDCVTSIGDAAFYKCSSLTSVTIPDSVTSIGKQAFQNCSSLTSIDIPSGVTTIGNQAFDYCSSLTSVNIPSGVTSIGKYAFFQCSSITSITIPNSVTTIGDAAFYKCSSLTSVTIPDSVTSIDDYAFAFCTSLESITINATTPPALGRWEVFTDTNNCPIYVPAVSVDAYKTAWSAYADWSAYVDRIQAIP